MSVRFEYRSVEMLPSLDGNITHLYDVQVYDVQVYDVQVSYAKLNGTNSRHRIYQFFFLVCACSIKPMYIGNGVSWLMLCRIWVAGASFLACLTLLYRRS